jgi:O-antigen ligase/tetratricopeptide (TPR) repeat protein
VDDATPPAGSWHGPLVLGAAVAGLGVFLVVAGVRPQVWWVAPWLIAAFALLAATVPPLPTGPVGRWARRGAYVGLLLLQIVVVVLTASVGPLLALMGALLLIPAVVFARRRRWRYLLAVGSAVLLVGVLVGILNLDNSPLDPLKERVVLLQRVGNLHQTGAWLRIVVWQATAQGILSPEPLGPVGDPVAPLRPLIGYGQESIPYLLNRVLPSPDRLDRIVGVFWDRSHNALLDRLLTTGILGLASYLALIGAILLVAFQRARDDLDAWRWGAHAALLVALLTHVLEIQFSMFVMPGEAVFWMLAGVAVGAATTATQPVGRQETAEGSPKVTIASQTRRALRGLPVGLFAGMGAVAAVAVGLASAPTAALGATVASLVPLVLAPFVGALVLAPAGESEPAVAGGRVWQPVALAGVTAAVALLLSTHQVRALAADAAFQRAEAAQRGGNFAAAIPAAQEAIRLAPGEPEYYHQLGQYYAALGGRTRTPGQITVEPTLATALSLTEPALLDRDRLFILGQISVEEALRRNPLEVRHYITLAELQRYWSEVEGRPTHATAALANFAHAATLKPNDVEIHAGRADTLLLAGDPAGAVQAGQRAAELLPSYWYPYSVLARAYLALGRPAEAYAAAQTGLVYAPRSYGLKPASPFEVQRLRATASAAEQAGQGGAR